MNQSIEGSRLREHNWPGIASTVAILWVASNIIWIGIAGPIWIANRSANPDAWIGFAGNALGAAVALVAAIVAGVAAYRTIVPMQRQLTELVRQNNFAHYERVRQRAADLTDIKILIEDQSLALSGLGSFEGRSVAFERLEGSVSVLNMSRRSVWGDENAQSLTTYFVDNSLRAANVARCALAGSARPFSKNEWMVVKQVAFQGGVALHARIRLESDILSSEIAALEPLILNRHPFPQLWKGDYPGPEKLADMYSGKRDG